MPAPGRALALTALALVGVAAWRWQDGGPSPPAAGTARAAEPEAAALRPARGAADEGSAAGSLGAPTPWPPEPLRWLAAAGGSTPEHNQISIAEDLALARDVLGLGGRVLFGAGAGSPSVQVLAAAPRADPVAIALGDLFAPRGGRDSTYRIADLEIDDAATRATVLTALRTALATGEEPLLVLLGGHGLAGQTPRDNVVSLWGGFDLSVGDLAEALDGAARPVLVVATTCFSGGFGEIAFAGADPGQGAATTPRCGLFAAPWDLEASGCDPDPNRAAHEGYAIHWLHALRGEDRMGVALPLETLDLDRDGTVDPLEAHTRVQLAADTADVPTTTAERWLRQTAPSTGRGIAVRLPHEQAVVTALAARLDLVGREAEAAGHLDRLQAEIDAVGPRLEAAQQEEDLRFREAAADLLARWPVLDDPWHPEFAPTLATHRARIEAHLQGSATYAAYLAARTQVDDAGEEIWSLRRQAAPYERLARAWETIELAGRLRARGGRDWQTYEDLRQCERRPLRLPHAATHARTR